MDSASEGKIAALCGVRLTDMEHVQESAAAVTAGDDPREAEIAEATNAGAGFLLSPKPLRLQRLPRRVLLAQQL
jgi:hypothetical protein